MHLTTNSLWNPIANRHVLFFNKMSFFKTIPYFMHYAYLGSSVLDKIDAKAPWECLYLVVMFETSMRIYHTHEMGRAPQKIRSQGSSLGHRDEALCVANTVLLILSEGATKVEDILVITSHRNQLENINVISSLLGRVAPVFSFLLHRFLFGRLPCPL